MIIYTNNTISNYIDKGFAPVPIPFKTKAPIIKGWPTLSISADNVDQYFGDAPTNIGILTGKASGGLVDVDIDDDDALKFAPHFLPATDYIFGRESKPNSHWVYRVPDAQRRESYECNGRMVLELRGDGHCTVFPGSVHPSGEEVEFKNSNDLTPSRSTWKVLKRATTSIAIAPLLYRAWSPGTRHELTLAIAALLARQGWHIEEVKLLINAVAKEAKDDELQDRLIGVDSTFEAYAQRKPISGNERLSEIIGVEQASKLIEWCSSADASKPDVYSPAAPMMDITTDAGSADAFVTEFKNRLIYCNGEWFEKQYHVFHPISSEHVQGLAKTFLQRKLRTSSQMMLHKPNLSRTRINASIELSRSSLEVDPELIDSNPDLIGCRDGVILELKSGTELINSAGVFVTRMLGTKGNQQSFCPLWETFLHQIFDGDAALISFVRRAVGYTLTGLCTEQCLFILNGSGANGKSTFVKVLHHLFGGYSASIPMQTLMNTKNASQQTNDLAYLVGKRFVSASEGEHGQRLAESKIKMMTGGDRIPCRALYKDYFEFDPQFKLWLVTNDLPNISGTDEAIWRRILVIPFPVKIPPEKQNKTLAEQLLQELPGILQWALEGVREWRSQGLNAPSQVLQSTGTYRKENDTVGQWIESACSLEPDQNASMKDLYNSYGSWCENSGVQALSNSCFGKELTRKGLKTVKARAGNARLGIGLRT